MERSTFARDTMERSTFMVDRRGLTELRSAYYIANAAAMARRSVSSGAPWEKSVGYSRAVRIGDMISVAGTTAPGVDAYAQTKAALAIIEKALAELGATMNDVVRTRMLVVSMDDSDAVGRAHGEAFADIRPAATMVEVRRLISPELLVEIEVDAIVDESR